jgi:hypothetical protein
MVVRRKHQANAATICLYKCFPPLFIKLVVSIGVAHVMLWNFLAYFHTRHRSTLDA